MPVYDLIIAGCGPSGFFCAITAAYYGLKTIILEKNNVPGKKILVSGSGQCNFTHVADISDFINRYGEKGRFLKKALFEFTNNDLIKFFVNRGVDITVTADGKVFPKSMKAKDLVDVLICECEENNVRIICDCAVSEITKSEEGLFLFKTTCGEYPGTNALISMGGKSYPGCGTTGDGYAVANSLGHTVVGITEGLAPVIVKDFLFSDLAGISFPEIKISLWRNNRKLKKYRGDILFTHKGLSGPGILDLSRYIKAGDLIKLSFIDYENEDKFREDLLNQIQANGKQPVKTIIKKYSIPRRVLDKLIEINRLSDTIASQLSREKRNQLVESLISYPFEVLKKGDFNTAMVTCGGINLDEINPMTMESRIVKNLYFAGEILDIDGDTGGYNIQAAVSTGVLAGKSIAGKQTKIT